MATDINLGRLHLADNLVIADLDGTISLDHHRRHLIEQGEKDWQGYFRACIDDEPNEPVLHLLNAVVDASYMVAIFSGRSDEVLDETVLWLDMHFPYYDALLMRPQGDFTPDHDLKRGWYEALPEKSRSNLRFVVDDRQRVVEMWRSLGVPCFQVAAGDF